MDNASFNAAVREGFARWSAARNCRRKGLTANCSAETGVRVVALDKSSYGPEYYIRYGIWLGERSGIVQEPASHIRFAVQEPWGAQAALRIEDAPTAEQVVELLERHIDPLVRDTATFASLEKLKAEGRLRQAAIVQEARTLLGWSEG